MHHQAEHVLLGDFLAQCLEHSTDEIQQDIWKIDPFNFLPKELERKASLSLGPRAFRSQL